MVCETQSSNLQVLQIAFMRKNLGNTSITKQMGGLKPVVVKSQYLFSRVRFSGVGLGGVEV